MTDREFGDALDRLLREDARRDSMRADPLEDRGDAFSARVMATLPAPAPRDRPWLKPALVLGSAALGCVLAAALSPVDATLVRGFLDLAHQRFTPAALTGLAMCTALLVSAIVLAAETE